MIILIAPDLLRDIVWCTCRATAAHWNVRYRRNGCYSGLSCILTPISNNTESAFSCVHSFRERNVVFVEMCQITRNTGMFAQFQLHPKQKQMARFLRKQKNGAFKRRICYFHTNWMDPQRIAPAKRAGKNGQSMAKETKHAWEPQIETHQNGANK